MCPDVNLDGSFSSRSGGSRRATLRNRVELIFNRFDYVIYEDVGTHLLEGWAAFFAGVLGRSTDFWQVQQQANLESLFNSNFVDIPTHYRPLTSAADGRFIYFFILTPDQIRGRPDRVIELHYQSATNWSSTTYILDDAGEEWISHSEQETDREHFVLERWEIQEAYAIALPGRVFPATIVNLFTESSLREASAYGATLDLCRIRIIAGSGPRRSALVFDPGRIVERTVAVADYHNRAMRIADARVSSQSLGRLSPDEQDARVRGILACLCKQLTTQSSIRNDANMGRLNTAVDRFANYGQRKARFFDNIYNFLSHPIMLRMENALMIHQVDNIRVDGYVWLEIVGPLIRIAGDHSLLAEYFQQESRRPAAASAWSAFFHEALRRPGAPQSPIVTAWRIALQGIHVADIAVGVAEIRAYDLVSTYTNGRIAWSNFLAGIRRDRSRLVAFTQASASGRQAIQRAQLVRRIFRHANTISQLYALLNGDLTTSTFTATLSSMSDFAERRGASYLATRAVAIKNTIDVFEHASGFADRLGVGDYDAALGRGLCLAAGVTELGYIIATGTTLGGPVGAVVSIIAVVGSVIIIFATDSEEELFMRHCLWGTQPRQDISRRDWMTTSTTMWANSTMGVRWQLESLINLLHKYDVRHNYQNLRFMGVVSNVLALDILTRFLPDTVKFQFRGRFTRRGGTACQIYFDVNFPPRVRPRADRDSAGAFRNIRFRRSGPDIVRGVNAQVFTESGQHRIRLHIAFTDGITEENGWDGEAWLKCFPFGHTDFSAPQGRYAFHLENLISHDNLIINHWRDYSFESDEWAAMPTWQV